MCRRLVPSVLLALVCVATFAVAAPVASALTRDAQLKQNVRLLQVYIERYAAGKSFAYPAAAAVKKGGGLGAPVWPANPWTGKPMAPGSGRGTFTYSLGAAGSSYSLVGHLSSGSFSLTGGTPVWLTDERTGAAAELSDARDQVAELGARVIKGYIEQWGMLYNGNAPAAAEVSATGGLGTMFPYWPANPFTGQPMARAAGAGNFSYSPGNGTDYSLSVEKSGGGSENLSGAIPQQLPDAIESMKSAIANANIWKIQNAVDRYALDYNDLLPAHADQATLGSYLDPWPLNPWFGNTPTANGASAGNYVYALGSGGTSYTITAYVSGNVAGDVVNGGWWTAALGIRDRLKNMCCQAAAQTLRDYVEEWKAEHSGTPPTVVEMTKTGAVGLAHAWWPTGPWTGVAMTNSDTPGNFQYAPGAGSAYTLTVKQQPVSPFAEYYTPQ